MKNRFDFLKNFRFASFDILYSFVIIDNDGTVVDCSRYLKSHYTIREAFRDYYRRIREAEQKIKTYGEIDFSDEF